MPTERDPVFGCEIWTGRLDRDGYGFHGKSRAHIVAWEKVNGKVPDGLVLDHGCRRRACCFEPHLEAVTQAENERRKRLGVRMRIAKCKYGHDLNLTRMVTPEGGVACRACRSKANG